MLHTKFHGNRPTGFKEEDFWRVFTIYRRGGHLGHVTSIMSLDFLFLVPESFHAKFGLDQQSRGLINSKFGVFYSNFLNLTPTF